MILFPGFLKFYLKNLISVFALYYLISEECFKFFIILHSFFCTWSFFLGFIIIYKRQFFFLISKCCFSVAQSCLTLCDPWTAVCQASVSFTISWSLLKIMSTESLTPSNHHILCRPLLLLPSILPSIMVFSNVSAFCISGQNIGASASASVLPMNIQY